MKTIAYKRSPVLYLCELHDEQKEYLDKNYGDGYPLEFDQFVENPFHPNTEVIPLSQFMRTPRGDRFDGRKMVSYFSQYVVKLSNCGEECIVAFRSTI